MFLEFSRAFDCIRLRKQRGENAAHRSLSPAVRMVGLMAVVDDLKRLGELVSLARVGLAEAPVEQLRDAVALVNQMQRQLDGLAVELASALRKAEALGVAPPASEVLRGDRGEVSAARAKQLLDRAVTSERFTAIGRRVRSGEARGENVDAVVRRTAGLNAGELERLDAIGEEIAERAVNLPPETFDKYLLRTIRGIKDPVDAGPSVAEQQRAASRFAMGRRRDGMWWLSGELDPERGALLDEVLRSETRRLTADGSIDDNTRVEALVALATRTGDGARSAGLGVGYIVDAKTLTRGPHDQSVAQTWGGDETEPAAMQRLSCNADLYAVLIDRFGQPAGAGLTRRAATREQRLQLRALYETCAIDGTTPFFRCEIHHVNVFYEDGGLTELDNLLPVSAQWHHRIHDRGWTLKMRSDRTLKLWQPNGRLHRSIPAPQPITRQLE